ncbi:MAG: hypothetical protein AB4290_21985 [Spirulina sp.]
MWGKASTEVNERMRFLAIPRPSQATRFSISKKRSFFQPNTNLDKPDRAPKPQPKTPKILDISDFYRSQKRSRRSHELTFCNKIMGCG